MNNIKFVGQLFKYNLISEKIITSIFQSLMEGPEGDASKVSDRTIEGALTLITKVGIQIDEAIQLHEEGLKKEVRATTEAEKKKAADSKDLKQQQLNNLKSIYANFKRIPDSDG